MSSSSEDGSSSSASSSDEGTATPKKIISTKGKMTDARKKGEVQIAGPSKKLPKTKRDPTPPSSPPIEPKTSKKSRSIKKKTKTPTKQNLGVNNAETSDTLDDSDLLSGMTCILEMSNDDLEEFLQRIDKQCPIDDLKQVKNREALIDWDEVSFSNYGPNQCRRAWGYLQRNARKFRIMHEIVDEIRYSFKADFKRFMKRVIEAAPDFPKQPYTSGGFQTYCKELWDEDKERRKRLKLKPENFLRFQKKCYQDWGKLLDSRKEEYNEKAKQQLAEFRQKVKDYYAQFPSFAPREKLPPGRPAGQVVSEAYKRRIVRISEETFTDAPKIPSNPLQLFMNSKINGLDPPPTPEEIPELKAHYMSKWKKLSNRKRLKWIENCVNKSEKYLEDIKEYKKSHPLFMLPKEFQISKLLSKDEYFIWAEAHGHPPKPKTNSFDLFYEDFRAKENEGGEKSETELYNLGLAAWEKLDWYNKEMYKIKNKTEQATFKKEFEDYYQRIPPMMKSLAVEALPKKYKRQFTEDVNKEPSVNRSEDHEDTNVPPRKKKKYKSEKQDMFGDSLESQEGTADDEEDGGSPKIKKRRKKKKFVGEGKDMDNNDIPLYVKDLSLQSQKLIEEQKKVETKSVNPNKNSKARNLREDLGESNETSVSPGKINQKHKRKRN